MPRLAALFAIACVAASGPVSAASKMIETHVEGKGYEFDYGYPAIVAQIPKLKSQIERAKAKDLADLKQWTSEWLAENLDRSADDKLLVSAGWDVVTNLPDYLSLTYDNWSFTGGVHGNWWRSSLIWDRNAQKSREPIDIFTSKAAFDKAVQTRYCDLLDVERSKRRNGEKVDRTQADDSFQACPKPSELVVILGSSNGKQFNRLSVYAAPYAVGPYVEADYEIDLPMTSKLLAIVKPQYRAAFAVTPLK